MGNNQATIQEAERHALQNLRCHRCGYLLCGSTLDRVCPECGTTVVDAFLAKSSRRAIPLAVLLNAILLGIIVPLILFNGQFSGHLGRTKRSVAQAEVASIAQTMNLWCLDNGFVVPPIGTPLGVLALGTNAYLRTTDLIDPWGRPYCLSIPGPNGQPFSVSTLGRDGVAGGNGEDADISSSGSGR